MPRRRKWQPTPVFFFNICIYFNCLLTWRHQGLVVAHRIFYLLQHAGPLVAACGAFSCSMQTLSCSTWDQVPGPGIEPRPPESQPLNHQESPPLQYSLPGKFHGQRSPVGYSPWGCKELDMTEYAHTCSHTHMHAHTWVWIPTLPLTGLATLGNFPSLPSASFFPRDTWAYKL